MDHNVGICLGKNQMRHWPRPSLRGPLVFGCGTPCLPNHSPVYRLPGIRRICVDNALYAPYCVWLHSCDRRPSTSACPEKGSGPTVICRSGSRWDNVVTTEVGIAICCLVHSWGVRLSYSGYGVLWELNVELFDDIHKFAFTQRGIRPCSLDADRIVVLATLSAQK